MKNVKFNGEVSVTDLWKNETNKLLNNLLETASLIPEIDSYLSEEMKQLKKHIQPNSTLVDFGCGNGRHLGEISHNLKKGLGVDMNKAYLQEAEKNNKSEVVDFIQGDIENFKTASLFDYAIAMYNTLGVVHSPTKVIESMLASVKVGGELIISLYSEASIPYRVKMYKLMGLKNIRVTEKKIYVEQGFITRHYNLKDLRKLFPTAEISRCSEIGWLVTCKKV